MPQFKIYWESNPHNPEVIEAADFEAAERYRNQVPFNGVILNVDPERPEAEVFNIDGEGRLWLDVTLDAQNWENSSFVLYQDDRRFPLSVADLKALRKEIFWVLLGCEILARDRRRRAPVSQETQAII
ncbi:MAG: hypothetical protein JW934_20885 [Anaerolineae bacterium]|nr:hypothetical protein [Anaerolineae bacterium]